MNIRSLLVLSLALLIPASGRADILWKSGFETGDLSEWSGKLNPTKDGKRQNIVVVDAPVVAGKHAAEITIHPDDLWPNNHNRVELHQDTKRTKEGQTTFFSWYFMLHADAQVHEDIAYWETSNSFQQSMALYVDPSSTGTTLGFRTNRPNGKQHFKIPLSAQKWHQLTMEILWSTDSKVGRVNVWLDGTKVADNVSAQTKPDGNDLFIQVGFHRDASASPVETISIDEAMEGTSLDDVLMKKVASPAPDPAESDAGVMPNPPANMPDPTPLPDAGMPALDDGDASVTSVAPEAENDGDDMPENEPASDDADTDLAEPQVTNASLSGGCHAAGGHGLSETWFAWATFVWMAATRRRKRIIA